MDRLELIQEIVDAPVRPDGWSRMLRSLAGDLRIDLPALVLRTPVGAAFFLWDHGTKHGDIQLLGVLSYGAPLLSTGILIAFGRGTASSTIALACLLIVGGALLAALDHFAHRIPHARLSRKRAETRLTY